MNILNAIVRDRGPVVLAAVEPKLDPAQCRVLLFRTLIVQGMVPVGNSFKTLPYKR